MASLVLLLSFLVRNKNKNQASAVAATSFDIIEDPSSLHLHARWAQQREYSNYGNGFEEMQEKVPQEPRVCIYLV